MYYLNEISELRKKFFNCFKDGDFASAITNGKLIDKLYKENNDTSSIDYAKDAYNIGVCYDTLKFFEKSVPFYKDSAEIYEKAEKTETEEYANVINNLAVALCQTSHEAEALSLHKKAFGIRERVLGRNHPDTIESLINIGNTYDDMDREDNALLNLEKALSRADRQKDFAEIDYSDILCSLARIHTKKGNYIKAIMNYSKAVDIIEKELGLTPYFVRVLEDAAGVCIAAEKLDMAIIYYKKALDIRDNIAEVSSVEYIAALNLLATTYAKNKDLENAIETFDFALKKVSELMDTNHNFYSDIIINKAYAYYIAEDYDEALRLLNLAYNMKVLNLGKEKIELLPALSKLVSVNVKAENYDEALKYCGVMEAIGEKNDAETKYLCYAYKNFAKVYMSKENYIEAEKYLHMAEELYEKEPAEMKKGRYFRLVGTLSEVCALNNEFDKAERYAGKVVGNAAEKYGEKHPLYASSLYKLAEKMILNNQFTAGIKNLEKAIAVFKDTVGADNSEHKKAKALLEDAYGAAAYYYMENGDFESALLNYEKCDDKNENPNNINFAGLFLAKDNTEKASEIIEKYSEKDEYSFYKSWLNLKTGGFVDLEKLKEETVFDGFVNFDLALFYEKCGDKSNAFEYFKKSVNKVDGEKYIKAARIVFADNIDELEKAYNYAAANKLAGKDEHILLLKAIIDLFYKQGRYDLATVYLERMIVFVSNRREKTTDYIEALLKISACCENRLKTEDAAEYMSEAALKIKEVHGENEMYCESLIKAAKLFGAADKNDTAKTILEKAVALSEKLYGEASEKYALSNLAYAKQLLKMGESERVLEIYEKVYNIFVENRQDLPEKEEVVLFLKDEYKSNRKLDKLLKIKLGKTI